MESRRSSQMRHERIWRLFGRLANSQVVPDCGTKVPKMSRTYIERIDNRFSDKKQCVTLGCARRNSVPRFEPSIFMGILDRFSLEGKTALVTGAASGLGAAIAIALAEAGAAVACHGNRRPADATADQIRAIGKRSQSFAADLSSTDGADKLFSAVVADMRALD